VASPCRKGRGCPSVDRPRRRSRARLRTGVTSGWACSETCRRLAGRDAGSIGADRRIGTPPAPRCRGGPGASGPPGVGATGSPVSLRYLLQRRDLQGLIGHDPLQPCVLDLEIGSAAIMRVVALSLLSAISASPANARPRTSTAHRSTGHRGNSAAPARPWGALERCSRSLRPARYLRRSARAAAGHI
jgi:hypothetical protein